MAIFETAHTTVSQSYGFALPGYLIVEPKSPCLRWRDLDAAQAQDLLECLARAENLIHACIGPERIYTLKFGEEDAHMHFHVFPRTRQLASAYSTSTGDTPPYSGAAIVDWTWKNHATLGHTDASILDFVHMARAAAQRA